ncbi:DUF1876 domain-containing protein [Spongiactinospora sp. TRM90649]|uniref:DUF1876 domain-containing protein n=1 Tax=Spongiactinospora sp. TRM90649 TaxID=3031114 RepID=UPI0023F65D54|nr:DUF1876 domain-containing protein [Spongiactinospora sp. TRM90649]MDF5752886.1 DUF1876 domain-containing protein [Spongiactinospora sp. TRM90649]
MGRRNTPRNEGAVVMTEKNWNIEILVAEDEVNTTARAVLSTTTGEEHVGVGAARRNPADEPVAEIGDEIAVGRALADLAEHLLSQGARDVARLSGHAEQTRAW